MARSIPNSASQMGMRAAFRNGWDIDFIRAKFNLSAKDVEKAIHHAGGNREKIVEYLRKLFSRK